MTLSDLPEYKDFARKLVREFMDEMKRRLDEPDVDELEFMEWYAKAAYILQCKASKWQVDYLARMGISPFVPVFTPPSEDTEKV